MFKKSLFLSLLLLSSFNSLAVNYNVKAFLVLDLLTLEKVGDDSTKAEMGYGTADVKFYFNHNEWSAKFKLDIDAVEEAGTTVDLMEEAVLSYRFNNNWKLTGGKGKVPFYTMHFGISERNMMDGGYLTQTYSSMRAGYFKRKYLLTLRYGGWRQGQIHDVTFFGSNQMARRDRDDESRPYLPNGDDEISYDTERTFNTNFQKGFAYKGRIIPSRNHEIIFGAFSYWRDIDPKEDYGFSLAYQFENRDWSVWTEALYGYWSAHPNDRYTKLRQESYNAQLGFLYRLADKWNVGINLEYSFVTDRAHDRNDYPADFGQSNFNDGNLRHVSLYKADIGAQYQVGRNVQLNGGILIERQIDEETSTNVFGNPEKTNAYALNFSLTTWL
ncbi:MULTISPECIES: hypothetical protein [Halobacteriovorax]|uniref:Porin n=1 Tax=Halobacteriovorax vibrionivorans TaxID=2152716 RepID=A0ABY0IDI8_9BACT|nr:MULTISPECIES: hypothetical protein [Halobacteriovorax]AYF44497.1 hypothetical protein BALOs_1496 [Halobacteriovorax sp. BALOs_7]RZF20555.1 hypothetical protein DAY19_11255 [Halobacteriovorax vibrionivorans]TGD47468.1 hypothetical protein EP118_07785 [Halobacteriovorax sp. Y22]